MENGPWGACPVAKCEGRREAGLVSGPICWIGEPWMLSWRRKDPPAWRDLALGLEGEVGLVSSLGTCS